MAEKIKIAQRKEIPEGEGKVFMVGDKGIAVFNVEGQFHAIDNTCAHQGGPLGEGMLHGKVVTCPFHAWGFDVTTGECSTDPMVKQDCFPVTVEGEDIFVEV